MTDKKELKQEDLEKVTGGRKTAEDYADYNIAIDKNVLCDYLGQFFFFKRVTNGGNQTALSWAYGTLINVFDKSENFDGDLCALVNVTESSSRDDGRIEFDLDTFTAYRKA